MKRVLLVFLVAFNLTHSNAQDKVKELLNVSFLEFLSAENNQCINCGAMVAPRNYIIDSSTHEIIGQNLLKPNDLGRFYPIKLNLEKSGSLSAFIAHGDTSWFYPIWEDGRIVRLKKIYYGQEKEFSIHYNDLQKIDTIKLIGLEDGQTEVIDVYEYPAKNEIKLTHFENNNKKKPWIRYIINFTFDSHKSSFNKIMYESGKPNVDKYITTHHQLYEEINDTCIRIAPFVEDTLVYTYNSKDQVLVKTIKKEHSIEEHRYYYVEGGLFKEETMIDWFVKDQYDKRIITIYFTDNSLPSSLPEYERVEGTYKFDNNNELVVEIKGRMIREKKDGVWTNWRSAIY